MAVVSGNVTFPLAPNANVTAEDDYSRYHQPLTPSGYDRVYTGGGGQTGTTAALDQRTLATKALALRDQVDFCHRVLDGMNWPGYPEANEKDCVEPGLEQYLQRAEYAIAGLLTRLTALAEHVGRL